MINILISKIRFKGVSVASFNFINQVCFILIRMFELIVVLSTYAKGINCINFFGLINSEKAYNKLIENFILVFAIAFSLIKFLFELSEPSGLLVWSIVIVMCINVLLAINTLTDYFILGRKTYSTQYLIIKKKLIYENTIG